MAKGLDPVSGVPAYRQIADRLRERIASGELAPGDRLPSEAELMDTYSAARATVRQAVGVLRSEGLVVAEQGRGAFVRGRPPVRRLAYDRFARRHRERGRAAFLAEMEGRQPEVEVLAVESYAAPVEIAGRLGVAEDAKVLRRFRRYLDGGQPLEIADLIHPVVNCRGHSDGGDQPRSGRDLRTHRRAGTPARPLRRGCDGADANSRGGARPAVAGGNAAVLHLVRTAYDSEGQAVEVCDTVMAADRYVLSYELPCSLTVSESSRHSPVCYLSRGVSAVILLL